MIKLCFATNNRHKLEEVEVAVKNQFTILSLADLAIDEELPETQYTLEGNALQKARYLFDKLKIPCFADDSGLEVDALNGEPGVYSARYAGPERNNENNMDLLLKKLEPFTNRKARFRTVIALVGYASDAMVFEGIVKGEITHKKKGSLGFGYDPIFLPKGYDRTFAEMSTEEKNNLSHRAIAIRKLIDYLKVHPATALDAAN
jgi:XTP/dITP diphosphohydrolase